MVHAFLCCFINSIHGNCVFLLKRVGKNCENYLRERVTLGGKFKHEFTIFVLYTTYGDLAAMQIDNAFDKI